MSKRMSIEEYTQKAAEKLGGEYKEIEKANGVIKHGIIINVDGDVRPTVYTDTAYENRIRYPSFVKGVREQLKDMPKFENPAKEIDEYDKVKPLLRARLYNNKTNAEVYVSAEPYGFDDLIIIPYIQFTENAATKVTEKLLDLWDKTTEEVIADALGNSSEYTLISMGEMLKGMGFPLPIDEDNVPLMVLTNPSRICGAIAAVTQQAMLKAKYSDGYKVIPSSIHEVLIIPEGDTDKEMSEIAEIIVEVNKSHVEPEERLGEHAYQF